MYCAWPESTTTFPWVQWCQEMPETSWNHWPWLDLSSSWGWLVSAASIILHMQRRRPAHFVGRTSRSFREKHWALGKAQMCVHRFRQESARYYKYHHTAVYTTVKHCKTWKCETGISSSSWQPRQLCSMWSPSTHKAGPQTQAEGFCRLSLDGWSDCGCAWHRSFPTPLKSHFGQRDNDKGSRRMMVVGINWKLKSQLSDSWFARSILDYFDLF